MPYTYRSLYLAPPSRQPRRTFDLAGSSRLVMPLDLPTFATDFEPSSLASFPSFRKHYQLYRRYDFGMRCGGYRLYTIVRSIIGFTRGRGTLAFSPCPPPPPPPFFSHAWRQTLRHRRAIVSLSHGAVNNLLQRFDNRFKMPIHCHVLLDRSLERVSCGSTRSSSRSPSQFFSRACTSTMFVSGKVSTTISHVTVSRTR